MNTKEKWLPVFGYEGIYSVSDAGNVMSMNYQRTGMLRVLVPFKNRYGYFCLGLMKQGKKRTWPIHVLVMTAFVGERPKGLHINHKSGTKTDNRLVNLEYCTPSENRLHAYRTGLQPIRRGERAPRAKLSNANVSDIRGRLARGETHAQIAADYPICPGAISSIASGRRWN